MHQFYVHLNEFWWVYTYHHNQEREYFHYSKKFSYDPSQFNSRKCHPRQPLACFPSLWITSVFSRISYKDGHIVLKTVIFCGWLSALSMILRFVHIVVCVSNLFSIIAEHVAYGFEQCCWWGQIQAIKDKCKHISCFFFWDSRNLSVFTSRKKDSVGKPSSTKRKEFKYPQKIKTIIQDLNK